MKTPNQSINTDLAQKLEELKKHISHALDVCLDINDPADGIIDSKSHKDKFRYLFKEMISIMSTLTILSKMMRTAHLEELFKLAYVLANTNYNEYHLPDASKCWEMCFVYDKIIDELNGEEK